MDDNELDSIITEALQKGTADAVKSRDRVWAEIKKDIKTKNKGEEKTYNRGVGRMKFLRRIIAGAAMLSLVFTVGTETGQAAVQKIKEFLVPEKIIEERIEGQQEKQKVSLYENKEAQYAIYYDEARYQLKKGEQGDRIVPLAQPEGDFPEVFMEISQDTEKQPGDMAIQLENQLQKEFTAVDNMGTVTEPVNGVKLIARSGLKYNSKVVKYYLVENGLGGTFIIKQQLFVEAEEGHGVRFDNMLTEFRVTQQE